MWGLIGDGVRRVLRLDHMSHAMNTIELEHEKIHGGYHFFICDEATLGDAATLDFQLVTPNIGKWVHMTFQYESTQEILLQIYEGATVTADGTSITPYNNNRNSGNKTIMGLVQSGGTVVGVGNLIYSQRSGVAGNINQQRGGVGKREREIILRQGTTYRFLFTSGGAANNFSYAGEWYETENKN